VRVCHIGIRPLLYPAILALLVGVHLWLAATSEPAASQAERLYTLRGHEGPITNLSFSPDGRLLATSSEDHTAKLWDLGTGRLERTLRSHGAAVGSVAFAPGGRMLATGSADGTVKLWDIASGRLLRTLPDGGYPVAFSPNGRLLAAASGNAVNLWNTRSWHVLTTLRGSNFPPGGRSLGCQLAIGQIAVAPDGKSLAIVESVYCGSTPGLPKDYVQLWDTATWRVGRRLIDPPTERKHVAFAPDSRHLSVASAWTGEGGVLLWNRATGKVRSLASGLEGEAYSIAYDPRGRWVVFPSPAGARLVGVSSGKQLLVVKLGGSVSGIDQEFAISPDGDLLASAREDGAVEIWRLPASLQGAKVLARASTPAAPQGASLVPSGVRPATREAGLGPLSAGMAASDRAPSSLVRGRGSAGGSANWV
jgi:WD40 repeat protein